MLDLWVRDTEITLLITISAVLMLSFQLMLCFRAKKLLIKLLPAVLFAVATITFYTMMRTATDWSAMVYLIFAVFSGVLLLSNGTAWGIWAIIKLVKKKKTQK